MKRSRHGGEGINGFAGRQRAYIAPLRCRDLRGGWIWKKGRIPGIKEGQESFSGRGGFKGRYSGQGMAKSRKIEAAHGGLWGEKKRKVRR